MEDPGLGEVVRCPTCNAGPGRIDPQYDGHGEGIPFATGEFRCEVCGTKFTVIPINQKGNTQ